MQTRRNQKYNQAYTLLFDLHQIDGVDIEPAATFAAGDIKIMKDEGAEANTTNLPTDEGQGYSIVLTAAEMSAARIVIYVIDQTATKVWLDISIVVETYGHASAQHAFDLNTASVAQTGDTFAQLPTNFSDLSIVVTTGLVNITQTAADKVWSSTTRTLSAFSTALALSVWHVLESAIVTASTIGIKLKTNVDATIASRPTAVEIRTEMDTNSADLDQIQTDIGNLNNVSTAQVLTQVNAALDTAIAELGVAAPSATPTTRTALMLMYMALRNRLDVDTTGTDALKIRNNAGTQIASKLITDDGTDYSEAQMS